MKTTTLLAVTLAALSTTAFAGPPAKVADLAWMAGTWQTAFGPNTLEENWVAPGNGSIGSLVRMTGAAGVSMWEVITVEEKDGSLALSIQQWGKGFESRTPAAQKMELVEIDKQRVKFKAVTEGSINTLEYARNGDTFNIELVPAKGNANKLELKAKK